MDELTVDSVPTGIAKLDPTRHFTWANRRFLELAHRRESDLIGRSLSDVFGSAPEDLFFMENATPRMMIVNSAPDHAVLVGWSLLDDGELVTALDATDRYAALLDLRRSYALADRTRARLELVIDASIAFASASTQAGLAEVLAQTAARAYRAEESAVFLFDGAHALHVAAGFNPLEELLTSPGVSDWVATTSEVLTVSGDAAATALSPVLAAAMREQDVRAVLVAPLRHDHIGYGVVACFFHHDRTFDEEAGPLGLALAGQAAQTLEALRLRERLEHAAMHDETTGLPNRRFFEEQLRFRPARQHGRLAVLFLDLDRFKAINDEFGHPAGDVVLREIGQRLQAGVRTGDIVTRYGGDEFVVVCDVDDIDAAVDMAERLRSSVGAPIAEVQDLCVGVSIGVALLPSDAGEGNIDQFVRAADLAMYRAKNDGGDRVLTT